MTSISQLFNCNRYSKYLLVVSSLLVCIEVTPVRAQTIVEAVDGTGTTVTQHGQQFNIRGGSVSGDGNNLFHSFDQFNLHQEQIANFESDSHILNILGRVNGGSASIIDGLIQVSGSDANLFLMNPAGILFGANARLDVGGDFTATTARGIGFDQGWFNAFGENNHALLNDSPTLFDFTHSDPGSLVNEGFLAVDSGQSLNLLGGLVINTGILQAPSGNISVVAVPEGDRSKAKNENALMRV